MSDSSTQRTTAADQAAEPSATASAFPQFAVSMANQQIVKVGDTLIGAADSLDHVLAAGRLPLGADVQDMITGATDRLRNAGTSLNAQDAGALLTDLQQRAATRPALSLAVGAALGVALAFAFIRMAPPEPGSGLA